MHQASILFTAAVMAMAGAWYMLQDNARTPVASVADARPALAMAQANPLSE